MYYVGWSEDEWMRSEQTFQGGEESRQIMCGKNIPRRGKSDRQSVLTQSRNSKETSVQNGVSPVEDEDREGAETQSTQRFVGHCTDADIDPKDMS